MPVIMLVLAATALPLQWRPPSLAWLDFRLDPSDIFENITGYIPVGLVLVGLGRLPAIGAAAFISILAETTQFVTVDRFPSPIDVVSNLLGAVIGVVIGKHLRIRSLSIGLNRGSASVAATLAVAALGVGFWARSQALVELLPPPDFLVNTRGLTSPGVLEGWWRLDDGIGIRAADSSGHGLDGALENGAAFAIGPSSGFVTLDGANDHVSLGQSAALRLAGSMTLSAWINASTFPWDDAAIVSSFGSRKGYQLDTTIDMGPRTIGFKLKDVCGNLMARYGATRLVTGTWYHVAGVYDAFSRRMDVYLNGRLDDGVLLRPSVALCGQVSELPTYIGRRAHSGQFSFAGSIHDVRIYSRALTQAEIAADMVAGSDRGSARRPPASAPAGDATCTDGSRTGAPDPCQPTCLGRVIIPGLTLGCGFLFAAACAGFWPPRRRATRRIACLSLSLAAGFPILPAGSPSLPWHYLGTMLLLGLAGGVAVVVSLRVEA